MELDVKSMYKIISDVVGSIEASRGQVLKIVDNIKNEQERLVGQLEKIRHDTTCVINEVDELEKQDKACKRRLVEVSSNFKNYNETDIKNAYDKASQIMLKYNTKKNEEKFLRERRDNLEMALKKSMVNIEDGEKFINQISIAMKYLEGDIFSVLEGSDNNSEMFIGMKMLEAQESERSRIARDIHDGPAQHMANVVMKVDICEMVLQKNFEEGLKELEDLKESVKIALKEVRSIIFDLRPMSLDDLGLNQTIQQTLNSISKELGIEIKMSLQPIKDEIEPIIQVAVYRIIQEIFNNIKKHSKASHVDLKMNFGERYLKLVISDDGIGFNVEETLKRVKTKDASYGLIGILDRVKQLQGEIDIDSILEKGTIFTVKLPINKEVIKEERRGD